MVVPETIEYKPYRSEVEPVTEVFDGRVILHPKHFESIQHYTYDSLDDGIRKKDDLYKQALLQVKDKITLTRTNYIHTYDKSEQSVAGVNVNDGESVLFRFKTDEEADKFYAKIRNWLLNS